jgi:hypothetical protein
MALATHLRGLCTEIVLLLIYFSFICCLYFVALFIIVVYVALYNVSPLTASLLNLCVYILYYSLQTTLGPRRFCLINVPTNETWEIQTCSLDKVMGLVMQYYYTKRYVMTDKEFVEDVHVPISSSCSGDSAINDQWFTSTEAVMAMQREEILREEGAEEEGEVGLGIRGRASGSDVGSSISESPVRKKLCNLLCKVETELGGGFSGVKTELITDLTTEPSSLVGSSYAMPVCIDDF